MSKAKFIQIHFLTAYGANVLNRDDLNRPKSMVYGNTPRLRLSSQSVKRAWRLSDAMAESEHGVRTRAFWFELGKTLVAEGFPEASVLAHIYPLRKALEGEKAAAGKPVDTPADGADAAEEAAEDPAPKKRGGKKAATGAKGPQTLEELKGNLFFFSQSEIDFLNEQVRESLRADGPTGGQPFSEKEAQALLKRDLPKSADVAMFGRMVAEVRDFSVEGAVQVAHAFTVNKAQSDDDFFTAVDDLASTSDDVSGSGHMGANAFGSGLYYGYVNIDVATLMKNLDGDLEAAKRIVNGLVQACVTVAPGAKQNTFAARSYATYACVETGNAQPRAYADAFLRAVAGDDIPGLAVAKLQAWRDELTRSFPAQVFEVTELNRLEGIGSLPELQAAAVKALG